jgi:hypothetical protein
MHNYFRDFTMGKCIYIYVVSNHNKLLLARHCKLHVSVVLIISGIKHTIFKQHGPKIVAYNDGANKILVWSMATCVCVCVCVCVWEREREWVCVCMYTYVCIYIDIYRYFTPQRDEFHEDCKKSGEHQAITALILHRLVFKLRPLFILHSHSHHLLQEREVK